MRSIVFFSQRWGDLRFVLTNGAFDPRPRRSRRAMPNAGSTGRVRTQTRFRVGFRHRPPAAQEHETRMGTLQPSRSRFLLSAPRWDDASEIHWPQLALGGRSNVGKSSLLNAMLGRRGLARTSSTPGRTQTLNFFLVDDRFVLVDLPGYGYAQAPKRVARLWRADTRRYIVDAARLRCVILLLDIRRDPSDDDRDFAELVRSAGRPLLPVVTKCDKVARSRRGDRLKRIGHGLGVFDSDLVVTSAKTGEGKIDLWQRAVTLIEAG